MTYRPVEWVNGPVHVLAPASSANLGPGFDSLGLALSLYDELAGEVVGGELEVTVDGVGAEEVARDETNLVVSSMYAVFGVFRARPPGLRVRCTNTVPHGRGLGSSAAAIVGGVVLARALVQDGGRRLNDEAALAIAAGIEGHPDNVAAALLGGLTIAVTDPDRGDGVIGGVTTTRVELGERLTAVAFVPPEAVATSLARGLLPETVPHADAAANAGRAALLVAAVQSQRDLLLPATHDVLHQRYREPAMPRSYELMTWLRSRGVPAVISGAGPTVLAFVVHPFDADELAGVCPDGWVASALDVDTAGARVVG